MNKSIFSYSQKDFELLINELSESKHALPIICKTVYRENQVESVTSSELSSKLKQYLNSHDFSLPKIIKEQKSSDGTVKFLIQFHDGRSVETVLLPFFNKYSLCLSSQVGCAMKCSFCFTGTQGLTRNLEPYEIISQYIVARNYLLNNLKEKRPLKNLVFMGQGEPLHNFDSVKKAIEIFTSPYGLSIGKRNITLSTSGYIPGLKRIKELGGINIALSLHSPLNEIRSELIPINKRYPIENVLEELDQLEFKDKQFIEYEYLLIDSLNDKESDAIKVIELLKQKKALINIIPFNEFPGSKYKRPKLETIKNFSETLINAGLRVMIRKTKGDDILAACGQLKS